MKALGSTSTNRPLMPLSSFLKPPSPPPPQFDFSKLFPPKAIQRKVFISYHHGNDQWAYDYFAEQYGEGLEIFYDNSLDGKVRATHYRAGSVEAASMHLMQHFKIGTAPLVSPRSNVQ